jgi:nucleotide-binding universal stress UspA family protein
MTILVPTDFSTPSRVAIGYAAGLAKKTNAKVIMLSVQIEADSLQTAKLRKLQESNVKTAHKDAERALGVLKERFPKVSCSFEYTLAETVVDGIESFAVARKVDLIVMGSKGATGLKKILMGSNATAVIDNSSVPVIVVPNKPNFKTEKSLDKIVYATDAKNFKSEAKIVADLAKKLNASLEVLHIMPEDTTSSKKGTHVSGAKLAELEHFGKGHVHILPAQKITKSLDEFVKAQHADAVAMFHSLDHKEKLFGTSVTRELAFQNTFPLLSFKKVPKSKRS